MPQTVNREKILSQLEAVLPGLSTKDIIEQSSCFVFKGGQVMTFNDEVACVQKSDLQIEGAVKAAPLLAILRKMDDEEIAVEELDNEVQIKGKRKIVDVLKDKEILLPVENVEQPGKWKKLSEGFLEAVDLVQSCAGKDDSQWNLTCVNLHPEWMEACDDVQMTRYMIPTGVKKSTLVRRTSLKSIVSLGVTKMSETETWIHFKNAEGLVLSCRRYIEAYPDLGPILDFKGKKAPLPKGLDDIIDRAEVASSEDPDANEVTVELKSGKFRIRSVGLSMKYTEWKKTTYQGDDIKFMISPKMLKELTKYDTCELTDSKLKVDNGKLVYVTCLGIAEEKK
jgi:hypothetical protein